MPENQNYFVHESSYVDEGAQIGENTKIWHFSHVHGSAVIGAHCSIGQGCNVGDNALMGNHVRVQNNVSIYGGVVLEDYVFCGPSMVFTNDLNPRVKYPKGGAYLSTRVKTQASIGANATIVCGNTIGRCAFVAAGAVVTHNVKDHAVVAGVPARQIGWACACGTFLRDGLLCKDCGRVYRETDGGLVEEGQKPHKK